LSDFNNEKNNFTWIKKSVIDLFGSKQSKVSSLATLLKIKQLSGQSLRDFLSSIRIQCQKQIALQYYFSRNKKSP